jgi:hypothetical protein
VVRLPFAADCCPCVGKLRTVLPLTLGWWVQLERVITLLDTGSYFGEGALLGELCRRENIRARTMVDLCKLETNGESAPPPCVDQRGWIMVACVSWRPTVSLPLPL